MDDWAQTPISVHDEVEGVSEFIDLPLVVLLRVKEAHSEDSFVSLVLDHATVLDDVAHHNDILAQGRLPGLVDHKLFVRRVDQRQFVAIDNTVGTLVIFKLVRQNADRTEVVFLSLSVSQRLLFQEAQTCLD